MDARIDVRELLLQRLLLHCEAETMRNASSKQYTVTSFHTAHLAH